MDEKDIRQLVEATIAGTIEQSGLKDVIRKFPPSDGNGEEEEPTGFKSLGDFLYNVKLHPGDRRLKALSEGTDSAGGFLVPEEFLPRLLMDTLERAVIRPYATVIPMATDTLLIPKLADVTHSESGGVCGGVIAYWTEEAGTKLPSQPTFGRVKLTAHELIGFTYASDQLLADSAIALEALLVKLFGGAIAWYEDEAFIDGSGVGEPLGFMNSGALISVARAAAGNTISMTDLGNLLARLYPNSLYGPNTVWIANPSILPQLMALATTSVNWVALDQGATKKNPTRLFGMPLVFTEKAQALGTSGDIALCDLSYYLIGDRSGLRVDVSKEYRFVTDETTWRFVKRVDGQPWVDSEMTPKHGSTLSPFVVLNNAT